MNEIVSINQSLSISYLANATVFVDPRFLFSPFRSILNTLSVFLYFTGAGLLKEHFLIHNL